MLKDTCGLFIEMLYFDGLLGCLSENRSYAGFEEAANAETFKMLARQNIWYIESITITIQEPIMYRKICIFCSFLPCQ